MIDLRCFATLALTFLGHFDCCKAQDFSHVEQFGDSTIYFYNTTYKNKDEATAACKAQGSHLLYIKSKAKQDFINGVLQQWSNAPENINASLSQIKSQAFRCGGKTDTNLDVFWDDESQATFYNKAARGFQKTSAVIILAFTYQSDAVGQWMTKPSTVAQKYICEKKEWITMHLLNKTIITGIPTTLNIMITLTMIEISVVDIKIVHKETIWSHQLNKNGTHPIPVIIDNLENVGNYAVKASYPNYNYSRFQNFFVYVPANISLTHYEMVVNENEPVSVVCASHGYYQPTITWSSYEQTPVTTAYSVTSEFKIMSAKIEDTSVYTCTATNYLNESEWKINATLNLTVVPLQYVPYLLSSNPLNTSDVKFNKKLVISCQFQGKPQPHAVWKINGKFVNASDEAQPIYIQTNYVNESSTTSIITVYDAVILGPQAIVSCEAFNKLGNSRTTTFSLDLDYFDGYYYWFTNSTSKKNQAQSVCAQYGGHLVNILNYGVDQFLKTILLKYRSNDIQSIYTGGKRQKENGNYYWTNNVLFYNYSSRGKWSGSNYSYENGVYFNWPNSKPNSKNCLILDFTSNKYEWKDDKCNTLRNFVCQFKAEPVQYLKIESNSSCDKSTAIILWQDQTKFNGTIQYSITISNTKTLETIQVYNFSQDSSINHKYTNFISDLQPNVEYSLEIKLFPQYWNFPFLNSVFSTKDKNNLSALGLSMSLSGDVCVVTWLWPSGVNILTNAQILVTSKPNISLKNPMLGVLTKTNHTVKIQIGFQSYNFSTKPNKQYVVELQQTMCGLDSSLPASGSCTTPIKSPEVIETPLVENSTITIKAASEDNGPISCYFVIANKSHSEQTYFSWEMLKSILSGNDSDWFCVAAVKRFEGKDKKVNLDISQNSSCNVYHVGVEKSSSELYTCENQELTENVIFSIATTTPSDSEVFVQSSGFVSISGKLLYFGVETTSVFKTTDSFASISSMTPVHIDPGDDNTALTVGICIGLLAIISLLIAVVLYRRQKGKPAKSSTSEETDPGPNVEVKDYAIPVNQLQSVYKCFSNNVEETFQAQFLSIKEKSEKLSIDIDTGIRPDHRVRNRYKNIVPYDYNRVKLQTLEDDSDYVNASFINGFRCENKYIATQGPLDATLGEFWQMIWEQNCSTIVMLANLYEKNKKKCSQYWPDGQEVAKFGKFSVQMNMEENYGSYVVRSMTLTMDESNCVSASRSVTQYHFTTWPDHGVPATTTGLMRFCSAIEAGSQDVNVPIVVHCSAGVGRTGTYIGLDILKNQIKVENQIDVFETVFNMRKQRIDMVQTLDQYILLHTLLYEICLFGETDFPSEEATSRAQDLERLEAEFGLLEHSEPINASQDAAFSEENSVFNRDPEVLPYDRTLVRLLSNGDDDSSDYANFGYINASVIQEYNCIDTTIVTQGPMATTQCAFWRLILDRSVTAVIMLTDVDENSCDEYWIDELDTQLNIGHVTVTMTAKDVSRPDMTKRQFQVEVKGVLKISVSHIQCNPWKATSNKEIANQLLELIAQSRLLRRDSLPIVVHCIDGAGRSGVFCALSNLLDRCRIENKLDVFRTVKDLRNTRPLMVRTLEDYNLVYETIASCFSDQSLYANV